MSDDKPVDILNGPNLNRLGRREPEIYGTTTLAEIEAHSHSDAQGRSVEFRQSNSESQLIDWIHEATDHGSGIVIDPTAYSFTSIAILDALKMFSGRSSRCTSATSIVARNTTTTRTFQKSLLRSSPGSAPKVTAWPFARSATC